MAWQRTVETGWRSRKSRSTQGAEAKSRDRLHKKGRSLVLKTVARPESSIELGKGASSVTLERPVSAKGTRRLELTDGVLVSLKHLDHPTEATRWPSSREEVAGSCVEAH